MPEPESFRVLSLDGGGMRGLYTAVYLHGVAQGFARRRRVSALDIGRAFKLIVGTSTGAILGCAIAAGVDLARVIEMYRAHGKRIFPSRLPDGLNPKLVVDLLSRPNTIRKGSEALRKALAECFGDLTLKAIYEARRIALAVPAVSMFHHRGWVFKTPHLSDSNHRDDNYRLVDVCLASTAAPVFRSLAAIDDPNVQGAYGVFADGGLWANNPVLVALTEALRMTEPGQAIQVFSIGTCPRPSGDPVPRTSVHRGLPDWKFGGAVANLGIDVQEFAFDNIARMIGRHLNRKCSIVRFPHEDVPAQIMRYLDLDDTSDEAQRVLTNAASTDANMANSMCNDSNSLDGCLIRDLFLSMPEKHSESIEGGGDV